MSELTIHDVTLFDGDRWTEHATVEVGEGGIAAITTDRHRAGADVIDGRGCTLLPGLIDSHVHISGRSALERAAIFGVTTALDMGMSVHAMQTLRKEADPDSKDRADFRSAGTLATRTGGHGSAQHSEGIPTIDRPEDADAFVAGRVAEGSDYIKVVLDELHHLGVHNPTLDNATATALVEAAHRRHLLVVAHIGTVADALSAVECGVDVLGHLPVGDLDQRLIDECVAKVVSVIPTMTLLQAFAGEPGTVVGDNRLASYLSSRDRDNLGRTAQETYGTTAGEMPAVLEGVRRLAEAGVTILAGTDAPYPGATHGAAIHGELELLVAAGLTPTAALQAATRAPAKRFGLDDRGSLREGLRADLLLVRGDPREDITTTRDIVSVWVRGERIDRDTYAASLAPLVAPRVAVPPGGVISSFEQGLALAIDAFGWDAATDQTTGGSSTAILETVPDGANGTGRSLVVHAELQPGPSAPWAGAMLSLGTERMAPADISAHKEISLWLKGSGTTVMIAVFTANRSRFAAPNRFVTAGPDWEQHHLALADFQTDGSDFTGLMLVAVGRPGVHRLQIDEVCLF
jgi:imidazolonepropionase-like amidohydrolase